MLAGLAAGRAGGQASAPKAPPPTSLEVRRPAPQSPAPPQATFSEEVAVAWILVPVSVKTPAGRFVKGLDRDDFELRVDGRKVRFPDFEPRGEVPWSLVFLQDLSGSMGLGGRLEASREAIRQFLDAARSGDEFALASFAGRTIGVDVPFTEDQQALRETLTAWEAYGRTALHDAVALLPHISGSSRNVKRGVILVTDGVDNASRVTPGEARELVRQAELPVYVLGLESGDPNAVSADGGKVYRYADVLNLLAAMTGGRYFPIHGPEDLKEACTSIAEELRFQYVLGFETAARGESRFRPISVTVGRQDVRVASRRGYLGTPPAP